MKQAIKDLVIAILFAPIAFFYSVLAVWLLWGWFVFPISYAQAAGIFLLARFLRGVNQDENKLSRPVYLVAVTIFILFGWIASRFL